MGLPKIPGIPGVDIPKIPGVPDIFKRGKDAVSDNTVLGRIETMLKEVPASQIHIEEGKKSEIVDFLEKGMKAIGGHDSITPDGIADKDFLTELNGFIMAKRDEKENLVRHPYSNLPTVENVNQISGLHIQAMIDSLRDQKIMSDKTPDQLKELGQALREIDNSDLRREADRLDPEGRGKKKAELDSTGSDVSVAQSEEAPGAKITSSALKV